MYVYSIPSLFSPIPRLDSLLLSPHVLRNLVWARLALPNKAVGFEALFPLQLLTDTTPPWNIPRKRNSKVAPNFLGSANGAREGPVEEPDWCNRWWLGVCCDSAVAGTEVLRGCRCNTENSRGSTQLLLCFRHAFPRHSKDSLSLIGTRRAGSAM